MVVAYEFEPGSTCPLFIRYISFAIWSQLWPLTYSHIVDLTSEVASIKWNFMCHEKRKYSTKGPLVSCELQQNKCIAVQPQKLVAEHTKLHNNSAVAEVEFELLPSIGSLIEKLSVVKKEKDCINLMIQLQKNADENIEVQKN